MSYSEVKTGKNIELWVYANTHAHTHAHTYSHIHSHILTTYLKLLII